MSYYQSNQAYNQAHNQDGVMNGAIIGGAIGAGVTGGVHAFGAKPLRARMAKHGEVSAAGWKESNLKGKNADKDIVEKGNAAQKKVDRLQKGIDQHHKTFGGGWKGKTLAYGGSAILGMGIGAGIDAMVD